MFYPSIPVYISAFHPSIPVYHPSVPSQHTCALALSQYTNLPSLGGLHKTRNNCVGLCMCCIRMYCRASEWFISNVCTRIRFKTCLGSPVPFCGSYSSGICQGGAVIDFNSYTGKESVSCWLKESSSLLRAQQPACPREGGQPAVQTPVLSVWVLALPCTLSRIP